MADNESIMTKKDGDRIDHVEATVQGLGRNLIKLETTVESLGDHLESVDTALGQLSKGMNELLQRDSSFEARQGMVPMSTVKWAVASLLTLVGIGLVVLKMVTATINHEIDEVHSQALNNYAYIRENHDASLTNKVLMDERYKQSLLYKKLAEDNVE